MRSVMKGIAAGTAEFIPPSVMIEKFAGVRDLVRIEFLDLNHT